MIYIIFSQICIQNIEVIDKNDFGSEVRILRSPRCCNADEPVFTHWILFWEGAGKDEAKPEDLCEYIDFSSAGRKTVVFV